MLSESGWVAGPAANSQLNTVQPADTVVTGKQAFV